MAFEHQGISGACLRSQPLDQRRLANARLAANQREATPPAAGEAKRISESREFRVTTDNEIDYGLLLQPGGMLDTTPRA